MIHVAVFCATLPSDSGGSRGNVEQSACSTAPASCLGATLESWHFFRNKLTPFLILLAIIPDCCFLETTKTSHSGPCSIVFLLLQQKLWEATLPARRRCGSSVSWCTRGIHTKNKKALEVQSGHKTQEPTKTENNLSALHSQSSPTKMKQSYTVCHSFWCLLFILSPSEPGVLWYMVLMGTWDLRFIFSSVK